MVSVVTGQGLGIERSSAFVLGSRGQLGSSAFGRYGENVYVNAATGNLAIQRQDEMLIGVGLDDDVSRSYNSLGAMSDDNGDNWQLGASRRVTGLNGTLNTAGSTITRSAWDGSNTVYTWDTTKSAYVSKEGAGSYDTLTFASNVWTWTDGDSRATETYDNLNGGRITASKDTDGNALTYTYTGSLLTRVTTQNGEHTDYSYTGNNLTQVVATRSDGTTETRVRYGYDTSNRLSTVTTDLTPADSSIADGKTVVTTYTYDGTSKRVASIGQTGGANLAITYTLIGSTYRVATIAQTQASGTVSTTAFSYDTTNLITTVTDQQGNVTKLTYDASGQLTKLEQPAAVAGAATQVSNYAYNANGDVTSITDAAGDQTVLTYDTKGNLTLSRDAAGNTISYTYDAANQRLTESRYVVPDPDGGGTGTASQPITTRYAYDAEEHLCYTVSDEGRVTRIDHNAAGQITRTTDYATSYYDTSALSSTTSISQATLDSWTATISDKSGFHVVGTAYDARGNISTVTTYTATDTSGNGLTSSQFTQIYYVYDQAGNLLNQQDYHTGATQTYLYDGLNRLIGSTDLAGNTTSIIFTDSSNTSVVTAANGSTTTSIYDLAGELISTSLAGSGITTETTSYAYDSLGHLGMVTNALGQKYYYLYDHAGRKVAETTTNGILTETVYDAADRIARTIRYVTKLNATQLAALVDANGKPTNVDLSTVRPVANSADEWTWSIYDHADRLIETINAVGSATVYSYDGASRVVQATSYANALSIAGYKTTQPTTLQTPTADATRDRVTRSFYSDDGLLVATLDATGALTQFVYDAAGEKIRTTMSATFASSSLRASGTLAQLITSVGIGAADQQTDYVYDDEGELCFTVEKNSSGALGTGASTSRLTEYGYDSSGNLLHTLIYGGSIATPASNAFYSLAYVQSQISSLGLATNVANRMSHAAYDNANRLAFSIDPAGGVTQYVYDAVGRITKTVSYAGTWSNNYDPSLSSWQGWATTAASNSNNRTSYTLYDAVSRPVYQVDPEGYVTETQYDVLNRPIKSIRYAAVYSVSDATTTANLKTTIGTLPADAVVTSMAYDTTGRLTSVTDGAGSVTQYLYNPYDQITDITVAYGTSDAATTHKTYDPGNRLLSVTQAYGTAEATTTSYTYDALGNVVTAQDGDMNATTYTYDMLGHVMKETDPTGAITQYQYDTFGNRVKTTDPRGNLTYSYYDDLDRPVLAVDPESYATATTYSPGGAVTSVTRYATRTTGAAVGTLPTITANPGEDATTSFVLDKLDRVTQVTDAMGYYEQYTLDAFGDRLSVKNKLGGITTNTFDRRGLLKSEVLPESSALASGNGTAQASTVTNTYSYDARGNRIQMVEAVGLAEARTTTFAYDKMDRLISTTHDAVQVVATDLATVSTVAPVETVSYDLRGNIIERKDAAGARTLSYYDHADRKIAEISPSGTLSAWTYDGNGNALTARTYGDTVALPTTAGGTAPAPVNASNYRQTSYTYDKDNRLQTSTIAGILTGQYGSAYATTTGNLVTTNVYDAAGNLVQTTDARGDNHFIFYDKNGNTIADVDGENYLTAWTLDADGNIVAETRYATRLSATVTTASDPNTLKSSVAGNANDRTTNFTYDKNGRRLTEARTGVVAWTVGSAGALTAASTSATVAYAYNGLGEVVSKREATGDTTTYAYDTAGRQTSVTAAAFTDYNGASTQKLSQNFYDGLGDLTLTKATGTAGSPGTRSTSFVYGAGGRLTSVTDASGFVTTYAYDIVGRTVKASYSRVKSDGSSVTEARATRYDLAGRTTYQAVATLSGTSWTAGDSSQTQYDAYGEVSAKGVNGLWQQTYSYDGAGRVGRATQADGTTQLYVYDAVGNVTLTIASSGTDLSSQTVSGALTILTNNGANAVGAGAVSGVIATIGVFDRRNQLTQSVLPYRELASGTTLTTTSSQVYNAFGEVIQTTDARGGVTDYAYNAEGRIIGSQAPTANWTSENGTITAGRATQTNYYDLSGRLVGARDANGNLNTLSLRAGTGYDGDQADTLKEFHADGGVLEKRYDVFGDMRTGINEVGKTEAYVYDGMDRLIEQDHQVRAAGSVGNSGTTDIQLDDYYAYDGLGQRIRHWNSQLGASVKETTDYDAQGRVIRMVDLGGDTTAYSYAWSPGIATAGMATFGGWTKTTTNPAGLAETEQLDVFGHETAKTDFGGHTFATTFDKAGRQIELSDSLAGDSRDTWFNTGLIATQTDGTISGTTFTPRAVSTYGYDANGNRTAEAYTVWGVAKENATVTYDAMNRMTAFTDTGDTGTDKATIAYEYDLNSNVRRNNATYHTLDDQGNVSSTTAQDDWYRYDGMNRFVITKGMLAGTDSNGNRITGDAARGVGAINIGDYSEIGASIAYDAAGERVSATYGIIGFVSASGLAAFTTYGFRREDYNYSADGYLSSVSFAKDQPGLYLTYTSGTFSADTKAASYTRDAMGRVTSYREYESDGTTVSYSRSDTFNARNQVTKEITSSVIGSDTFVNTTTNDYGAYNGSTGHYDGAYQGGVITHSGTTATKNGSGQPTTSTVNAFVWWDAAEQSTIRYVPDTSKATTYTSTYAYDALGHLASVSIADGRPRTVSFVTSADGTILQRDEADNNGSTGDPREVYYYFDGIRVGDVSNDGTSDTDYAASIAAHQTLAGTGPFRLGATAGTAYADFDQSYDPINGLNYAATASRYTVQDGDTLQSIAQGVWGDSSLWYMLADANGMDGTETLVAGQDLVIPNKVANVHNNASTYRVYDPNEAIGNTSPTDPKPAHHHNHCGVFGQILLVVVAVAVAALIHVPIANLLESTAGSVFGTGGALGVAGTTVASDALAGAVGSIASQGVGLALGIQDKFSFAGVALAGLGAGIGGALGGGPFAKLAGSPFLGHVVDGVIGDGLTQGIAVATGLQHRFDWSELAAAGLAAGVSSAVEREAFGLEGTAPTRAQAFVSGIAGAIAGAGGASLVTGTDFGDNLMRALPSVIGQTIGNLAAGQIAGNGNGWGDTPDGVKSMTPDERAAYDAALDQSEPNDSAPTSAGGVSDWGDGATFSIAGGLDLGNMPRIESLSDGSAAFGSIDVKKYEGFPVTNIDARAFTDPRVGYLPGLEVKGNTLTGNVLVDFNNVFNVDYNPSKIISAMALVNQTSRDGYGINLNIMPDTYVNRILHPFSPTVTVSLIPSDTSIDGDPDVGASYSRTWDSIRMHADAAPQWIEHEFTHNLGLNHSGFPDSVMFPVSSATETQRTNFHIGEIKNLVNGYRNHK